MSLKDIEETFVAAAKAEWAKIESEGIVVAQEIVAAAETTFSLLARQFAPLIMSTISSLAVGEAAKLSGSEKTNLAATTIVDAAALEGIAILAADATALIKNGFEAFKSAAPALVPAPLAEAAGKLLDAGEAAVEKAVDEAASGASSKVEGDPAS